MIRNKKILTGLDHSQYEHPFDQKALKALKATPGLSMVGNFIAKHMIEKYTQFSILVVTWRWQKIIILKFMSICSCLWDIGYEKGAGLIYSMGIWY